MSQIPPPAIPIPPSFQLDSGLREDMIFTVHSAYFAPHADYQDGKVLMLWLLGTDEDEDPVEIRMSIGSDWQTDDGNVVTHPTRKAQTINKTSIYGFWLQYTWGIAELARLIVDRGESLGAGPRDARIWSDVILHLQLRELSWGRGIDPQERLMPVEFLGLTTDQTLNQTPGIQLPIQAPPTPSPQPTTQSPLGDLTATPPPTTVTPMQSAPDPAATVAAARQAAAAQAASAQTNGSPLFAKVIDMARSAPDFSTFLTNALGDPDVLADDELAMQCADQTQVWASAHSQ